MAKFDRDTLKAASERFAEDFFDEYESFPSAHIDTLTAEKRSMLVIIDVINGFIREGSAADPSMEGIIPEIINLVNIYTDNVMPVISLSDAHAPDAAEFAYCTPHCIAGTYETLLVSELREYELFTNFFALCKNSSNAFFSDGFIRAILANEANFDNIVVVGDCSDSSVLQFCLTLKTYFNTISKNCEIFLPVKCIDTFDSADHNKEFFNAVSLRLLKDAGITLIGDIIF